MYNNHFCLAKIFIQGQIDDFKLLSKNQCVVSSYPLAWIFIIRRYIPWAEEPGRLPTIGLQRVGHDGIVLACMRAL